MSNYKQSSIEFIIESLMSRNLYTKELLAEFEKAREMHQDEIEAAIIKNCATESTFDASKYASAYSTGYSSGYQRALEMVKWKIDNELRSK